MTIPGEAIIQMCVFGSPLQTKLPAAIQQCPENPKLKYWPRGKCPPFKKFMQHLKKEQAKATCPANALGWINNGKLDKDAVLHDMTGLNPEIGQQMSPDALDKCVSGKMKPLKQKLMKCKKKYRKGNQMKQLEEGLNLLIGSECMVNILLDTCHNYMSGNVQLIIDLFLSYNGPLPTFPPMMGK